MKIHVERFTSDGNATLSIWRVDGRFQCFGLEDEYRDVKVYGETRIPAGTYKVTLRREGGFHSRYGKRFSDIHRGMLWLRDVPGFEWILIHCGNTDKDTAGCPLVGVGCSAAPGRFRVTNSTGAYRDLYARVVDAAERGELEIKIVDLDRGARDNG